MAKARVLKKNNRLYLELPESMPEYPELELFELKPGYCLISLPLELSSLSSHQSTNSSIIQSIAGNPRTQSTVPNQQSIAEEEKIVLTKLLSIRFEKRVPPYVAKVLSEAEKQILAQLEKKGFVNVYKGKKYKDGVYNIKDSIYPLISQKAPIVPKTSTIQKAPIVKPTQKSGSLQNQPIASSLGPISELNQSGFLLISDKKQAFDLSQSMKNEMKEGAVVGVKGFDGKFYIVTINYLLSTQGKISSILDNKGMKSVDIAVTTNLDPDGCIAVLRIMAENGDIIEKKKGIFALV